jgi:hypothetical protein
VRRPLPHGRLVLVVLIIVAVAIAGAYAWTLIPPGAGTKAAVLKAVVGYELVPAPVWPTAYWGAGSPSPETRARIQDAYARRVSAYTSGALMQRWQSRDFVQGLLDSRKANDGRICIAGTGKVVYYRFRSRRPNGDLVVRVGVQHRYEGGRWNAQTRAMADVTPVIKQVVVIMDYTLTKVEGEWKVVAAHGWRFLDTTDGHITYDPPGSTSPAPASPAP